MKPGDKFTLQKARTLDNTTLTDDNLTSPHQVPDYIIKTLMIVDYHAREFEAIDKDNNARNCNSDDDESKDDDAAGINPMDGLLCIFHRADIRLQRALAIKLSACQLSVPFLLPDPEAPSTNITMLLSALENITKSWKGTSSNSESANEVFATAHPFPVASFFRIGKNKMSKSLLINKIMSDQNDDHDIFFHKDIKGGHVKRKVADGLVEISWFLPGESANQTLKNEICFANLRGDAGQFKKQLDLLLNISSVLCILLPSKYPDETTMETLKQILQSKAKVILIFKKMKEDAKKYFDELGKRNVNLSLTIKANKKNKYTFYTDIRKNIQTNLHKIESTPLAKLASSAHEYGIRVDHYQLPTELENIMETWLKLGTKEAKNLLKLQTHVPKFADLEREKYCPTRQGIRFIQHGNERPVNEIYDEIEREEEAQQKSYENLDRRVLGYLTFVVEADERERNLALDKMKHHLDMMSRKVLAELHRKYRVTSLKLQKKKESSQESVTPSSDENELVQIEKSIPECSFGLEHIIRELAQLYQLPGINPKEYAGAAAEMLLSGQPLELMDGDSSYIPLPWFNAVYAKLAQKTNKANIFVISVLGMQSSGKSTLLNTMFGLEFRVSSGSCTRGAFACLIPVGDALKTESNIDYILVIDTEGLKGSGDPQLRERDNELATFATGVADVTIVNIFGENHNEIKEFLEISVHAFLKMKLVHKKKTCVIVHQNVAATDARDKLGVARVKLKEDLDKMTKIAASQEKCEDKFQKFDDIISYDANKDVFYLPSLLQGSPPMAPVNPEYGRGVQKIIKNITTLMCSQKSFQLSISHFRKNVCILWNAMLKENFIFCFRNTIEVRAYTSLDRKHFQVFVKLMVIGMKQLEKKIQVALKRCTTRDERKEKWEEIQKEIQQRAEKIKEDMQKEIETFIETNEDKAILEEWREFVNNRITQQKEMQVLALINICRATFSYLQNQQDVEEKKQTYKDELLEKAQRFMTDEHSTDKTERKRIFDQKWKQWIDEIPCCLESKLNINNEMVKVLVNTDPTLNTEMKEKLHQQSSSILNFKDILPDIDINKLHVKFSSPEKHCIEEEKEKRVTQAKKLREIVVTAAHNFVKQKSQSPVKCTPNDIKELYHQVTTTITDKTKSSSFTFDKCLTCDILLYIFANVYTTYNEIEENYIKTRDIRGALERNLRPELETYFFSICDKMEVDVLAANSIAHVLQGPIKSDLNRTMGPAVTSELLKNKIYMSKSSFHANVLVQLGEEGNFKSYIPYLNHPVKFLREKLTESIINYCLKQETLSVNALITREVEAIKGELFAAFDKASELTRTRSGKLTFWIQRFVENCRTLEIKKDMFAVAAIYEDLQNIDVFEKKLCGEVEEFLESLIQCGVNEENMKEWKPSPHNDLLASMFDCECCCPFCRALCDQTVKDHAENHFTKIHRPQGLTGHKYTDTRKLVHEICTADVAGNGAFRNPATSKEWHPYKDYQTVNDYYKSWTIPPDPSFEASTYWQWFMATFSKELAEHYKLKEPDIPSVWKKRTFNEGKDQLREEYNI